jgi:disulfide bond formation protein DsbB
MTGPATPSHPAGLAVILNHTFLLMMLTIIAGILTAAMTMQFAYGELPCPLCLLERVALFGVAFGIILNFRHGFSYRNTGLSLLFAIFLLIVSVRQTLLDIYPRPGHAYIGTAILGLHMPVWSILIAVAILTGYALKLTILGSDDHLEGTQISSDPWLARVAAALSIYVIALCVINFAAVILQCGLGECHTDAYALLK